MPRNYKMLAKTLYGLEDVLADEIRNLGGGNVRNGVRAVFFEGDEGFMYKANLCLRTALRILKPVAEFRIRKPDQLYTRIRETDWSPYLDPGMSFAVDTVLRSDHFAHSVFVSQRAKDAIADQFRERTGRRPSVSLANPDVRLHLHLQGDQAHLSLDSSGNSLHLRGYRTATNIAPINEVLAAGILSLSGWDGRSDFLDPMCGSGTLLVEAAMMACNIPAGINRDGFGFQRWKDFDEALYKTIHAASLKRVRDFRYAILGYDKAPSAIRKAQENIENANLSEFIRLEQQDFFKSTKFNKGPLHLVCNPPYGERLTIDQERFYGQFGDTLKQSYPNTRAWVFMGDPELVKKVGLRSSRKIKLYNGSLESRLALFEMYEGSKKVSKQ